MESSVIIIIAMSILALITAVVFTSKVVTIKVGGADGKDSPADVKLKNISAAIAEGAMAFLIREYKVISIFIVVMTVVIFFLLDNPNTKEINEGLFTAIAFVSGAIISCLAGFIGMRIATMGNVRTAQAAKESISKAFRVAFDSGAVMGFGLIGLAILGLIILFLIFTGMYPAIEFRHIMMETLAGFGLGGSSVALFARVGGGIYTKAADVGADLVGKVEKGIPEDDPRNPATIADNVGDNVGDIAGMGADLFGSAAEATCAALVIGATATALTGNTNALLYPVLISAFGIPASLVTTFFARVKEGGSVEGALKKQLWISTILVAAVMYFVTDRFMVDFELAGKMITKMNVYFSLILGLFSGMLIGMITEYYTSHTYKPVREVADACNTGAATNIIYGLALGYKSSVLPVILLVITIVGSSSMAGMYGIAIAALGMISTIAIGLTIDAYGPVSDNAGGIAEMAGLGKEVRDRTDTLDAAGNTTAAVGKGFAIGSAALTSLALFVAFVTRAKLQLNGIGDHSLDTIELLNPFVIGGLLFGAMLPFLFSAFTMKSVGDAAKDMVEEVRRQFKEIPGLMEGTGKPDYKKCVDISTTAALREMIAPGLLVILSPLLVGWLFGIQSLAGMLVGALVSGVVLAISSANSGGAWDNAKKFIEASGKKGTDLHKAAVVGDTVGDPFKDTSGPSINILIKLMAIISLVFVEFFVTHGGLLIK